ncbi:helix-turn-helix domain-containing protein [Micromonospora chalcea]|uniref:helix-turn-helix domain-containing protein n=1 Tax=Micromonospora chalcea TaxID=1874 RepID=UPI0021A90608|nr:helix-turn-helix domain-containing protein [Micromonospora chalcea]MCT2276350.1 helix-turn-helix domain-containing protein [Micromonospora chalcea]
MSSQDDLKVFTFAELAELWKTGEDWLRRGVSARVFPHHRIANEIRFTYADAAAILASREVKPAHVPTTAEVAAKRADAGRT